MWLHQSLLVLLYLLLSPLFPIYVPWVSVYNTDPKELDQLSQEL